MWNWFNCYLSGRHDYRISSEAGAIFLRCPHCGRRSPGWLLDARPESASQTAAEPKRATVIKMRMVRSGRVLPFNRAVS